MAVHFLNLVVDHP